MKFWNCIVGHKITSEIDSRRGNISTSRLQTLFSEERSWLKELLVVVSKFFDLADEFEAMNRRLRFKVTPAMCVEVLKAWKQPIARSNGRKWKEDRMGTTCELGPA